jgi:hypothetical protein
MSPGLEMPIVVRVKQEDNDSITLGPVISIRENTTRQGFVKNPDEESQVTSRSGTTTHLQCR